MASFQYRAFRAALIIVVSAASLSAFMVSARAGIIGTYVDAKALSTSTDPSYTGTYNGPLNTTPQSAFSPSYGTVATLWDDRPTINGDGLNSAGTQAGNENVIESDSTTFKTPPTITTTVTGLPADAYTVYILYWSVDSQDWSVRANLSTEATLEYDKDGAGGRIAGTDTGIIDDNGTIHLYEAAIGTVIGTSFAVDIQNSTVDFSRTWYDGVAYQAPEPASLSLLLIGVVPLIRRRRMAR